MSNVFYETENIEDYRGIENGDLISILHASNDGFKVGDEIAYTAPNICDCIYANITSVSSVGEELTKLVIEVTYLSDTKENPNQTYFPIIKNKR